MYWDASIYDTTVNVRCIPRFSTTRAKVRKINVLRTPAERVRLSRYAFNSPQTLIGQEDVRFRHVHVSLAFPYSVETRIEQVSAFELLYEILFTIATRPDQFSNSLRSVVPKPEQ